MSRGKKFVALSLMTFIVLIVLGARWGHHGPADPTGPAFNGLGNFNKTTTDVPLSQKGINDLASQDGHLGVSVNIAWMLMCGFLVLFMQVGFAFLVTGLTRAKNAAHMMMMNVAAFAVALLAYYAVGFAFQFGGIGPLANIGGTTPLNGIFGHGSAGLIGLRGFGLQSGGTYDVGVIALFLFEVVFMETAGYIIIGAIAERISFAGFLLAEVAMGALIYPIYGNWVWGGGWMAHLGTSLHLGHGAVDFAGSGVVHGTGGWAALALAMILGPRIGKYNADGSPNAIPGHNIPYVVIGTLVLIFGWMGFNPGSTLGATDLRISIVAVNTLLAACIGFVMAMITTDVKYGKPDISMSCNGMLAGLVAITAGCAFVAPWAAIIIGAVAGVLVVYSVEFWDRRHIDDPCGAISVHGVNGAWGVIAVGLFADGTYGKGWNGIGATANHGVQGLFYGDGGQLVAQLFHVVVGFIWAWGLTWIIFSIAKRFMQLRVSPEVEIEGLDVPEFGVLAYPDFVITSSHAGGHVTSSTASAATSATDAGGPK
ncbi:MAG: ammonium transporter, Amt family [Actinomycetota bacterium]|nr:ammonium transporter, Amt family [Actinomycetota bacterium]